MHHAEMMQALVFDGPGRMNLRPLPRPRPEAGEVLVRVCSASICGTDVRILAGRKTREVRIGHTIGHECAGLVAEVGEGVTAFAPSDRVGLCPVVSCGDCEYCRGDHENLCAARYTLGYRTDGSFAQYMLIPAQAVRRGNLVRLPDTIPLELAPLLEPLACCINGQHEMGLRGPERTSGFGRLVIFGAGPIGLMHLMLAKTLDRSAGSAGHVTVVEPSAHRREMAARLGADAVAAPDRFEPGGGFDAAILAVGVTSLVDVALRALRKGGKLNLFAGFDAGATIAIEPNLIHYGQLQLTGASESRRRDFLDGLSLVADGRLRLEPLLTAQFQLSEHEAAFQAAADGSAIKVAFCP